MPKGTASTLPGKEGKYLFNVSSVSNKISMTSIISLSKLVYSPVEYHNLKEFFNRIVATHQSQIVFKKAVVLSAL